MMDARQRQLAAALALLAILAALVLAIAIAANHFPHGITVLACLVGALAAAWQGVARSGPARAAGIVGALLLLALAIVLVFTEGPVLGNALVIGAVVVAVALTGRVFRVHRELPSAASPKRAVLFYNPKSGGGKAERFRLAEEASKRGIEPRELHRGEDLNTLVEQAVADGADALAMAGGDGSQAIVAAAAARHGLPYACIPSGTRNHFALDLGVDRDDPVGALDAFVNGVERVVDLADVNGRIFVNNVSLGVYAEAVQHEGYRDAKIRTLASTAAGDLKGGDGNGAFRWRGPSGELSSGAAVLMVSNDPYRLGRALGSGTRPRLDLGTLGLAAVRAGSRRVEEWTAPEFAVESDTPVAAGIDGEAVRMEPPLEFRSHPQALRVRLAAAHPGASPSEALPETAGGVVRELGAIASGRSSR